MDRSSIVGIITDVGYSPHTPAIIQGLRDTLRQQDYYSIVINAYWEPSTERTETNNLLSHSGAGVVFVETWLRTANSILDLANKPYVYAHRLFRNLGKNSIAVDDQYGAELAVNHLLSLGHRQIGFINGPQNFYATSERLMGYQTALSQAGLTVNPGWIAAGDFSVESGYAAMQNLMQGGREITAVFPPTLHPCHS